MKPIDRPGIRRWLAERVESLLVWLRKPEFPEAVFVMYVPVSEIRKAVKKHENENRTNENNKAK